MFLICIPFLLVLGYLLVEWFSLTQSSIDGVYIGMRNPYTTYLQMFIPRVSYIVNVTG